tara:strand:+ start:846 stop:1421 length:576 start_codon:yes stop_codon:yes gene_type:complete
MRGAADGFIILLLFLFIVVIGVSLVIDVDKEWIFSLITAAIAVVGWLYSSIKNSQREVEARQFSEKAIVYRNIFELFPRMMLDQKRIEIKKGAKSRKTDDFSVIENLFEIKSSLTIWGSEQTIKAWIQVEKDFPDGDQQMDFELMINNFGQLYMCMREDLGHSDFDLSGRELFGIYLNNEARIELFGEKKN